jgi:hypothetical protein
MLGGIGLHFYIINQIDKKFGVRHKLEYYWFIHVLFGFILSSFNVSLLKSIITGYITGCVLSELPSIRKHLPPHYKFTEEEKEENDGCLMYIMLGWLIGELCKHILNIKFKSGSLIDTIGIDNVLIE